MNTDEDYYSELDSDLDSSNTIMSTINESTWLESISIEDTIEIENMVYEFIGDYLNNEIHTMSSPYFHDNMKHSIFLLLEEQLLNLNIYSKDNEEELELYIDHLCEEFYKNSNIQKRSTSQRIQISSRSGVADVAETLNSQTLSIPSSSPEFSFSVPSATPLRLQTCMGVKDEVVADLADVRNSQTYRGVIDEGVPKTNEERKIIKQKIEKLKNIVQPKQKTEDWYNLRNEILTASNIWKVFSSEAQQNSLIYEKCSHNKEFYQNTNVNSTLHWGNKYEPLSLMIYEDMTNTKVEEFGCIIHEKYPFIGASPDGIVTQTLSSSTPEFSGSASSSTPPRLQTLSSSTPLQVCEFSVETESQTTPLLKDVDRYGRMIEIKNIVNRDITGIPKEEYWIQMQIQMETCDLNECDFVETRFKEYENEEDFFTNKDLHVRSGVILYFINKTLSNPSSSSDFRGSASSSTPPLLQTTNIPHYEYMDLNILLKRNGSTSPKDKKLDRGDERVLINKWINTKKEELKDLYTLYEVQYWYLDEISIVLVERNKDWFKSVVPRIENFWKIIEKERVEGYEHRNVKKKIHKTEIFNDENSSNKIINNMQNNNNICLIKLNDTV